MGCTEEQLQVCQRYGSAPFGINLALNVGIALKTLTRMPINATRLPEENGTSGWYIHGGEYSERPDFYQPLCGEHLHKYCSQIIKYLALAPGYRLIIDNAGYEDVWYDSSVLEDGA